MQVDQGNKIVHSRVCQVHALTPVHGSIYGLVDRLSGWEGQIEDHPALGRKLLFGGVKGGIGPDGGRTGCVGRGP